MYAEERRQSIAELARSEGRVDVVELARRFDVTPETVRRDLTDLETRGIVRRVHGGAMPVERFQSEPAVSERAGIMANEKRRIAEAGLAFVPRGGSILLDAGTTTGALAGLLPVDRELTIVTNSLPIAMALAARTNLALHVLGGRLRGKTLANVDAWALAALADLSVDVAFVAANGVSPQRGLSTPDVAEAAVKRAMVAAGRQVILLADHSKVGEEHLQRFARTEDVDVFVTDRDLAPGALEAFQRVGVEVVLA